MSQIEELYCDWVNKQPCSSESNEAYDKIMDIIESFAGSLEIGIYNEIYCAITGYAYTGEIEAFKAGFRQATALWKEC